MEASISVVGALQAESQASWLSALGGPVDAGPTNGEARGATNQALGVLDDLLRDQPRDSWVAAQFGPEARAELDGLRQEVDRYPAPGSLSNAEVAHGVSARYADLISSYLDANEAQVLAIDDPDLREGAVLICAASRQSLQLAELVRVLTFGAVTDGLNQPAEITEVADLWSTISEGASSISSTANPAYRGIVDDHFPETLHTSLQPIVDGALAGAPIDIAALLDVVGAPEESYGGLNERLKEQLEEQVESLNARG
jgi:hypothetical protein